MLKLGTKVIFISDRFELGLPIGDYGFIIAYDRNADNVFDYVVRAPKLNKHFFVSGEDIELEEVLLEREAERIEKEALIDFALATRNQALFQRIMNGDTEAVDEEELSKDVQSREDFVKQINLKAWI
jgi:hypothetical protein